MNEMQFEKGDRVFHVAHRWCEVIARASDGLIKVWLSRNGTTEIEYFDPRELFFEEIVIPESARTRPKHAFKPGDPVCVRRSSKNALWLLRAFVEERNGEFVCVSGRGWQDGWPECVPYDPTLLGFDAVEEKNDE